MFAYLEQGECERPQMLSLAKDSDSFLCGEIDHLDSQEGSVEEEVAAIVKQDFCTSTHKPEPNPYLQTPFC